MKTTTKAMTTRHADPGLSAALRVAAAVLVLLFSLIPGQRAMAAEEIYGNGTNGIYIDINSSPYTDFAGYAYGEYAYTKDGCAWFASARYNQLTGSGWAIRAGSNWMRNASSLGLSTGTEPQAYSLACFSGHVAVVEAVDGDTLYVSQGGNRSYPGNGYCSITRVNRYSFESGRYRTGSFLGYVYFGSKVSGGAAAQQTPVSATFSDYPQKYAVSDTNAVVSATLSVSGTSIYSVSEIGVRLYDAGGNLLGSSCNRKSEGLYPVNGVINAWYDMNAEAGVTLQPGTTYQYRFYCIVNGQELDGEGKSFTTTGSARQQVTAAFSMYYDRTAVYSTNAVIGQTLSVSGASINDVTEIGIRVYDSNGYYMGTAYDGRNTRLYPVGGVINAWYDLNSDVGVALSPSTTYYFQFYCVIGGQELQGDVWSLTTRQG